MRVLVVSTVVGAVVQATALAAVLRSASCMPVPAPAPVVVNVVDARSGALQSRPSLRASGPRSFTRTFTVTQGQNIPVTFDGVFEHAVARCLNQSTSIAMYVVAPDAEDTLDGLGPFCAECTGGPALPPLGVAHLRVAGGVDGTVSCDFSEQWPGGAVPALSSVGFTLNVGDARYVNVDGDEMTGALTVPAFTATGAVTLGNAAADTVTSTAAAWTFQSDTTVALTGGVNGLNFDANTLSIDASGNLVGLGTAAPGAKLHVVGDILLQGASTDIASTTGEDLVLAGGGTSGAAGSTTVHSRDGVIDFGDGTVRGGIAAAATSTALRHGDGTLNNATISAANTGNGTAVTISTPSVQTASVVMFRLVENGVVLMSVDGDGHHVMAGAASSVGAGSCDAEAITAGSSDTRGQVTATCDAGETVIITFGSNFSVAPTCTIHAADADAAAAVFYVSASAVGSVTLTALTGDADPAVVNYHCFA